MVIVLIINTNIHRANNALFHDDKHIQFYSMDLYTVDRDYPYHRNGYIAALTDDMLPPGIRLLCVVCWGKTAGERSVNKRFHPDRKRTGMQKTIKPASKSTR
jgi:hypothetical protein